MDTGNNGTAESADNTVAGDRTAGFSLVELIVVIVILGVLAAVAVPIFDGIQQRSKENAVRVAVRNAASHAVGSFAVDPEDGSILPPGNLDDPFDVMVIVWSSKKDPLSVCAMALGPNAPTPTLRSGPGCDRYDWME